MQSEVSGTVSIVLLGVVVLLVGCGQRPVTMDETQRKRVAAAVEDAMHSFEQAERARDAEGLIAQLCDRSREALSTST